MIRIYADREALSRAAAELVTDQAHAAVRDRGRFCVALAGGETPLRSYELLAHPPLRNRIRWERVHVFWGDERCVPSRDLRNNASMARRALLDHVPLTASQIHPINCVNTAAEAAREYEVLLRSSCAGYGPGFDLVLLELGEDGHTAALLPGTAAVEEQKRWVIAVHPPGHELQRVTLTAPFINRAKMVAFLVAGAASAAILRAVLEGPPEPARLPAQLIHPENGELLWLVDREAASLLSRTE